MKGRLTWSGEVRGQIVERPTLDEVRAMVEAAGYRVSAGSWESEDMVYASSIESIPGTYGHPRYDVSWRRLE